MATSQNNFKRRRVESEDDLDLENEDADLGRIQADRDNHTTCINDKIDVLLEVFDEKTCLDVFSNYYEILSEFLTSI